MELEQKVKKAAKEFALKSCHVFTVADRSGVFIHFLNKDDKYEQLEIVPEADGGIVGVAAAVWLAARLRLLERASYGATFVGGLIGFVAAALIAVKHLHWPVIPMATVSLIGLGALLGKIAIHKRAA